MGFHDRSLPTAIDNAVNVDITYISQKSLNASYVSKISGDDINETTTGIILSKRCCKNNNMWSKLKKY